MLSGTFRQTLLDELLVGFRLLQQSGEPLPLASYYAARIAEIIGNGAPEPLKGDPAFYLYQEVLAAVETARATVLGEIPIQ